VRLKSYRTLRDSARNLVSSGANATMVAQATGISRASLYRSIPAPQPALLKRKSHNALSEEEKKEVMSVLNSEEFVEDTPWQVVPKLQDQGRWLCSVSTMYRLLKANNQLRERRHQRRHPKYVKPTLEATLPNQVWTWDITRLPGPHQGDFFYAYVMLDLYSRMVVGWMIAMEEASVQAQHFIREAVKQQGVDPNALIIHSDRGSPMKAKSTVKLLASLGLSQSFTRPRTSNDNAFSEANFKTLKYHRYFKPWYESKADAEGVLDKFFQWYNNEHMHSGLGFMTPATVHEGKVEEVKKKRLQVLKAAYHKHPERFSVGAVLPLPPEKVTINLPKDRRRAISYLAGEATLNRK
jgi:putative transposase